MNHILMSYIPVANRVDEEENVLEVHKGAIATLTNVVGPLSQFKVRLSGPHRHGFLQKH